MAKKKDRKYAKIVVEIGGEQVRKSIAYRTLAEYEEKKKKLIEDAKKQNTFTFKRVALQWQEQHEEQIQLYTAECYKKPLKDVIEEFGDELITEITPEKIQKFLDEMATKKYAKQTIKLRKTVLKQIFDFAIFNQHVMYNPVSVCKVAKTAPASQRLLPDESDIETIKNNLNSEMGLYCALLMYTGMRREEALAVSYEDFDLKSNLIRVNKTLIFDSNSGIIRDSTKSTAGNRFIPFIAPLQKILTIKGKKGLLFNRDGRPLKKGEFDKAFNKYRKDLNISCTSHQLRHYFCTVCFDAGLDEKDLQEIMGHSKIAMSKDIYTHIRKQRKQDAADKLNSFLMSTS